MKALVVAFAPAAFLVLLVVVTLGAIEYGYIRPMVARECASITSTVEQFDTCYAEVLE